MKKILIAAMTFVNMILLASAQNVGIGTTTPTYPLTVISKNNKGIVQKDGDLEVGFYTSSGNAYLQTWTDHPLRFSTNNNAAQMTLLTNGNVGIGVLTPINRLQVEGSAAGSGYATIYGLNSGTAGSAVLGISSAAGTFGVQGSSNNGTGVYGYSNIFRAVAGSTISGTALYGHSISGYGLEITGNVKIAGGNTNPTSGAVLTSDASGNAVWKNNKIAFKAYGVASGQSNIPDAAARRVQYGGEFFDVHNDYVLHPPNTTTNANSSTFTAPVSGVYSFSVSAHIAADGIVQDIESATLYLTRNRNGVETTLCRVYARRAFSEVGGAEIPDAAGFSLSVTESLLAGDKIYVQISQTSGTVCRILGGENNWFSGHLVFSN